MEHEALRALGLTEYGARAYSALVTLRTSGAPEVAEAARVPRTRIYSILKDLERRGWVEAQPTRPKSYRAVRPDTCVNRERARLDALVAKALPELEARYAEPETRFVGSLWGLQGEAAITERAERLMAGARRELLLLLPHAPPWAPSRVSRVLRAAVRRGVRLRALVGPGNLALGPALASLGAEVRIGMGPPACVVIADFEQALIVPPAPLGAQGAPPRGIWNPSAELVQFLGTAIEPIWSHADSLALQRR